MKLFQAVRMDVEVQALCEGAAEQTYTYIAYVIVLKIIMNVHQQVHYIPETTVIFWGVSSPLCVGRLMVR